jgi:transposase
MIFAHKIALDLTQAQEAYCRQAAGTARFTYNWGYPTFKKKGQHDSFYIANDKVQVDGKRLRIPKLGLGTFRQMLTYKAEVSGTHIIVADRWFPSTRLCVCGVINETITLADRVFSCAACGHANDRDVHAALNLERYPRLVGNDNACGDRSAGLPIGTGETVIVEAGTTESALLDTF